MPSYPFIRIYMRSYAFKRPYMRLYAFICVYTPLYAFIRPYMRLYAPLSHTPIYYVRFVSSMTMRTHECALLIPESTPVES